MIVRAGEPWEVRLLRETSIVITAAALACLTGSVHAQDASDVSKASLIAESGRVAPGSTVLLGLHFKLADGWHIYWNGRNDTGFAPEVDWTLPQGVTVGPFLWPAPERYVSPGDILDHVYEGNPTILVPITISPDAAPGATLAITGEAEWLVCKELCLPGFGPISIELTVGEASEGQAETISPSSDMGYAAMRLPEPVTPAMQPDEFTIAWMAGSAIVRAPGAKSVEFYPALSSASLTNTLEDARAEGDSMRLRLATEDRGPSTNDERRLVGVLAIESASGEWRWYQIDSGPDGFRAPENAELISRVRQRVGSTANDGG